MIHLVVNWAPLTGDRATRQQAAWNSIEKLIEANHDFDATTAVCPGDSTAGAPRFSGILPRKIGRRGLPYIRDLLDHAGRCAQPEDWIGLVNSDVILTQAAIDRIRSSTATFAMVNVTDIEESGRPIRFRPKRGGSIDGVFLKLSDWDAVRGRLPEMVLGSGAWDTAFALWSFQNMDSSEWFEQSECLHVLHGCDHWVNENDEAYKVNMVALGAVGGMKYAKRLRCSRRVKGTGASYRRSRIDARLAGQQK